MTVLPHHEDRAEAEALTGDRWGEIVHDHAARFLDLLADGGPVTFQTFDDSKAKRQALARIPRGSLRQCWPELVRLNEAGAGVYVMINAGDQKGRTAENVIGVRALFLDLDGTPLEPVQAASPQPHLVTETSPGRYQCLWMINPCAPDRVRFSAIQKALARHFGGDQVVDDLPRVCRLPGFWHRKREPFLSRLIAVHRAPAYPVASIIAGFDLRRPYQSPRPAAPVAPRLRLSAGGHDGDEPYAHGLAVLRIAARRIAEAPDGEQHKTLIRECFGIGQLVAAGEIPETTALQDLLRAGQQMTSHDARRPWTPAEVDKQVHGSFDKGRNSPRGLV
jgi:hypothetical protein